jgi:two-component system, NarL family, sensor histidine kinase UhpB
VTEGDTLILSVRDDGRGIRPEDVQGPRASLGILGMEERARQIGGRVQVSPVAPGGTRVMLSIPGVITDRRTR